MTPAMPAILRWLLSGRPAQQDVAAEILSNAAEPAVLSAVAATQGAVDALAEMLQGRWESRYWAAACLAQLACCPETDAAVPEARLGHEADALLPPDLDVVDQAGAPHCCRRREPTLIKGMVRTCIRLGTIARCPQPDALPEVQHRHAVRCLSRQPRPSFCVFWAGLKCAPLPRRA